jgi:putative endonuclease
VAPPAACSSTIAVRCNTNRHGPSSAPGARAWPRGCPSCRLAAERRQSGDDAEAAACAFLQARGLQLVARNLNYRVGEIDLLMRDGGSLTFVEVRLRKPSAYGDGAQSVGPAKQRKLALAAQAWLAEHPAHARSPCRFDVVAVTPSPSGLQCEWIANAFTLDDL